jgi:DNA-directed RNA polymerase subunit beta'
VIFADKLMQAGFGLATRAGISISIGDMLVPQQKHEIISAAEHEVKEIEKQYTSGLVTDGERYNKVVDIWGRAGDQVGKGDDGTASSSGSCRITARRWPRSPSTPST